jgi:predicted dehydrogenase
VQGKSDDIEFIAAHTRTRASAEVFCREKGVPLVDSYEQILKDPKIDAVVLATPHSQHEQQVLQAAAAGKHIHVEKPITLDRASADVAVAAARKAGVVLAVGYSRRFHPSVVEAATTAQGRPARHRRFHGGAAHHQHRAVHPGGQLRAARKKRGRRADGGRGAFARSHDRVRRPRA